MATAGWFGVAKAENLRNVQVLRRATLRCNALHCVASCNVPCCVATCHAALHHAALHHAALQRGVLRCPCCAATWCVALPMLRCNVVCCAAHAALQRAALRCNVAAAGDARPARGAAACDGHGRCRRRRRPSPSHRSVASRCATSANAWKPGATTEHAGGSVGATRRRAPAGMVRTLRGAVAWGLCEAEVRDEAGALRYSWSQSADFVSLKLRWPVHAHARANDRAERTRTRTHARTRTHTTRARTRTSPVAAGVREWGRAVLCVLACLAACPSVCLPVLHLSSSDCAPDCLCVLCACVRVHARARPAHRSAQSRRS